MNANTREEDQVIDDLDLAVIIVSYNVRDLLRRCLQSITTALADSALRCDIIVVDNASNDDSAGIVRAEFPHVRLIALDTNRGFAGGNNVGLRAVQRQRSKVERQRIDDPQPATRDPQPSTFDRQPRYVLLLNPDTEIVGDALAQLVRYIDAYPAVAVVGPQLRYADGTTQSSRRRFPTIGTLFSESTLIEQWWPHNRWARSYRYEDRPADTIQQVDWLVGAALLARVAAIERAGLLDEGFFMYSEELEWQARLRRFGAIVYLPDAVIVHHEGKSSEQNLARRHITFQRSKLRYAGLRWGRIVRELLRAFLLLTYLIQLLIEAAKWLFGHKRGLRRQRIAQYGTILRSGL